MSSMTRNLLIDLVMWVAVSVASYVATAGVFLLCGGSFTPEIKSAVFTLRDGTTIEAHIHEEYERIRNEQRGNIAAARAEFDKNRSPRRLIVPATALMLVLMLGYVVLQERAKLRQWFAVGPRSVLLGLVGGVGLVALEWVHDQVLTWLGVTRFDYAEFLRESGGTFAVAFLGAVAAPVAEELYFRGRLHDLVQNRFGVVAGVSATAIVFAAVHGVPQYLIGYAVMAVVFSLLRIFTRGLVAPIIAHSVCNLIVLSVLSGS
ncbi:MAG: CPBP family intramembrane metalloprotease [Acidobacteriia bacterium]|nr:CPBP family intramembrane metalloprotease [Terriglobia bacterium]